MIQGIGGILFLIAAVGLLIGLISPQTVIFWRKGQKTRTMVSLVCGLIALTGFILISVGHDNFDAGKKSLEQKDYGDAVMWLSRIEKSDPNYQNAQPMLVIAREGRAALALAGAKEALAKSDYSKVIELLNDFPLKHPGEEDVLAMREQATEAIAKISRKRKETTAALEDAKKQKELKEKREVSEAETEIKRKRKESSQAAGTKISTPAWDTSDPDVDTNGNIERAVTWIKTGERGIPVKSANAEQVQKSPWRYYGRNLCFAGQVGFVEDYPPGSDHSYSLGGGQTAQVVLTVNNSFNGNVITSHKETYVLFYLLGGSGNLSVGGSEVELCGLPVGRATLESGITSLAMVGLGESN